MRRRIAAPLSLALAGGVMLLTGLAPAQAALVDEPIVVQANPDVELVPIGSYETGVYDQSAAEIVAYFAAAQRLLVVNAQDAVVEVLDASDPTNPSKLFDLETTGILAEDESTIPSSAVANSVTVRVDGLGAVAVEDDPKTGDGWVVFFDAGGDGSALGAVRVGAQPDMLTFTPDGTQIVVADEGEPSDDYSADPEGTIAVIQVPSTIAVPAQTDVTILDFHDFEAGGSKTLPADIRIFGGCADSGGSCVETNPVSENLEPEYATISEDSTTAWVTLQEANGIAIVDLTAPEITEVVGLGTVDRSEVPLDASDEDSLDAPGDEPAINIATWDYLLSFFLPDSIGSYTVDGETFLVTANEGDTRMWEENGYEEESRVKNLDLCPEVDTAVGADEQLGRLTVTIAQGYNADRDCYDQLYAFGTRSFSIWNADAELVWDSGSDFEEIVAAAIPDNFNSDHSEPEFDTRSDAKGPEPEGVAIAELEGRWYAFIALERVSGVMVYDVTEPTAPDFAFYINNRDFGVEFSGDADDPTAAELSAEGDLGPEGLTVIPAVDSPTGAPLLVVANEVSGTTTLYSITVPATAEALPETGVEPGVLAVLGGLAVLVGMAVLAGTAVVGVRPRRPRAAA